MAFVASGQGEQKGGDREAGENVRRVSKRQGRALAGKNKEKTPRRIVKEREKRRKGRGKAKGGSGKDGERKVGKGRGKKKGGSAKARERKAGKE